MTKLFLAAGVAALAIAAPAAAEKGQGGGKGNKGQSAKVERGGGGHGGHKGAMKVERRGGGQKLVAHGGGNAKAERRMFKAERKEFKAERKEFKADRKAERQAFKADRKAEREVFKAERRELRDEAKFAKSRDWDDDWNDGPNGQWANGCPPGLSKHAPMCMPHGQYKKFVGQPIPASYRDSLLPVALRDYYMDDDDYYYRLGNGYVYRVDRDTNLVAALLPLLGGGLTTGQLFPSAFSNYLVPSPYRAFYPDSSDDYYRFANGYVYEIDRGSGMIENMIPLMANGYGVGQMLPASYSVYNVPYQYRDMYADTGDYMYRYAPGAIYQVDPTTQLITAVASLLTGNGLSVGQPLPMGYSTYNVPLAYRDQYYDTSDAWYRYNNGNIYQVDPTTQLVTSIIRAIV